jgi:hypothetical protein
LALTTSQLSGIGIRVVGKIFLALLGRRWGGIRLGVRGLRRVGTLLFACVKGRRIFSLGPP